MRVHPNPRDEAAIRVVLGSRMDLHPGIHGSLRASPPSSCHYTVKDGEHVFLHGPGRRAFSPVRRRHWAELVSFGRGSELVHSVSWPVLGRRHWVVELDDFGYPVVQDPIHLYISQPGQPLPTGSARVAGVEPQLNVARGRCCPST